ncbi:hypothetical protein HDU98_000692 [Podochytrium sp. JEL0797]|nr:hypothetical protein HDU98_000692 [Podochytrium sp. JEL0797]
MNETNPHLPALHAAFQQLQELESATDFTLATWTPTLSVFMKPSPMGSKMPITKGVSRLHRSNLALDQIFATMRNVDVRKEWDPRFEGVRLLDTFTPAATEALIHTLQKGQWPAVPGRDFCLIAGSAQVSPTKGYSFNTSVQDARAPGVKGRVRGHVYCVGWVFEKAKDGEDAWDLTYFSHLDPMNLPKAIGHVIAKETPACADSFARFVEAFGPALPSF